MKDANKCSNCSMHLLMNNVSYLMVIDTHSVSVKLFTNCDVYVTMSLLCHNEIDNALIVPVWESIS